MHYLPPDEASMGASDLQQEAIVFICFFFLGGFQLQGLSSQSHAQDTIYRADVCSFFEIFKWPISLFL